MSGESAWSDKKSLLPSCQRCKKVICPEQNYYRKHMQTHKLVDTVSKVPDPSQLLSNSKSLASSVLKYLASEPHGPINQKYYKLVCSLLERQDTEEWENFGSFVCRQFVDPFYGKLIARQTDVGSMIIKVHQNQFEEANYKQSKDLLVAALGGNISDSQTVHFIYFSFHLQFMEEFKKSLWQMVRIGDSLSVPDVHLDDKSKQTIHSIAGSIIKGFMRFCRRNSENVAWKKIVTALRRRVINYLFPPTSWNTLMKHGPRVFVGLQARDFFETLAKLLIQANYKNTKYLPHDEILDAVLNGRCYHIWDELIDDSLKLELSLNLLQGVTRTFTNTYGRSIALKKMK